MIFKDKQLLEEAYKSVREAFEDPATQQQGDKSLNQWHQAQMDKEAALDKKEAYKDSLMRRGEEDEEEIDPLTDPKFREALDILEDLQARSPEMFEKFVTRLMDIVDYKKGVSL